MQIKPSPRCKDDFVDTDEQALIDVLLEASFDQLPVLLAEVHGWQFEHSANLENWAAVLNRFDLIYTFACKDFEEQSFLLIENEPKDNKEEELAERPEGLQWGSISDARQTVFYCLRFTSFLLQNSYRKDIFNSGLTVT